MGLLEDALAAVDQERLERTLAELIKNPSVDGSEAEVQIAYDLEKAWAADGMKATIHELDLAALRTHTGYVGEEVDRTKAVCTTATFGNDDGPHILLLGHTDVVPTGTPEAWTDDPFSARIEVRDGQRIMLGRGTCDMKAGLVAAWEAVRAAMEVGAIRKGRVTLASVCGEEDGGLGTFGLVEKGIKADLCVIPEPTKLAILPTNAGALICKLTVIGVSLHASRAAEGISAFEKFLPVYEGIKKLELERNRNPDKIFEKWDNPFAISVGKVTAGDWASSVPGKLVAECRVGINPKETVEEAKAEFEAMIAGICQGDEWLRDNPITVEWFGGAYAPGHTDWNATVVTEMQAAHKAETGQDAEIYGAPYGSDLRLLSNSGTPTIQYGPGDVTNAHSENEFVSLEETLTAARAMVRLLVNNLN